MTHEEVLAQGLLFFLAGYETNGQHNGSPRLLLGYQSQVPG